MASATQAWKGREEYKKQKALEEARKAGTAPAEVDEEGKEINPHIPQYIAQAPWYLSNNKPSLKHQKKPQSNIIYDKGWYERGVKGPSATKYRKGACENCGAMTHKTKECTERPRAKGARWTNKNIQADEIIQELVLDFDGKRDRWNGYNPDEHAKVIEKFEKINAERRRMRAEQVGSEANGTKDGKKLDQDGDDTYDETKGTEAVTFAKSADQKNKTTIRNLRIREDTAKYLRNLDVNSAYYDPKTRSMRENPNPNADDVYAGDNFVRSTGDVRKFNEMQRFAWEASERGQDLHTLAAPSQAEYVFRQFKEKKEQLKETQKKAILEKYGGEEFLEPVPAEIIYSQTENYVEYTRDGRVIKGADKVIPKSKYDEDVYINNHTSVWGSYWENGKWGYACCHSLTKNSYCVKTALEKSDTAALKEKIESDKAKAAEQEAQRAAATIATTEDEKKTKEAAAAEEEDNKADKKKKKKDSSKKSRRSKRRSDSESSSSSESESESDSESSTSSYSSSSSSSSSSSESDSDSDRKRKSKSRSRRRKSKKDKKSKGKAKKDEENKSDTATATIIDDDRKRPYNSLAGDAYEVTEAEMEEYRQKKIRFDDPMKDFIGKDNDE